MNIEVLARRAQAKWGIWSQLDMVVEECSELILAIQKLAPDPADMAPITALHTAAALAIAMGTGFFFSLFPAYQASRMDPIEALRYE